MKENRQDGSTVLPQNHKDMNVKSIELMNKMRLFGMAEAFRTSREHDTGRLSLDAA